MKYIRYIITAICVMISYNCYAADIKVNIDGQILAFDVPPVIQSNRTLVPMRKIFEELGCSVEWMSETRTIIATKNSKIIALQIGKNAVIISDVEAKETVVTKMDVVPAIYNNRTMIPLRSVSELLGCKVVWNDISQTVDIITDIK